MSGAAPGRIVVRDRVTQKVTEAVAASIIGVDRDQVSVTVSGSRGALGVQLRSPFPVPPLDDTAAIAGGWFITLILGVVGALLGGWLGGLIFGVNLNEFFSLSTWALAIGGSIIVLLIYGLIFGRKKA